MKLEEVIINEILELKNDKKFKNKSIENKKEWLKEKYQIVFKDELYYLNGEILEKGINNNLTIRSTIFLEVLSEIKGLIKESGFNEFLSECDLKENEIKIINNCLNKEGLERNLINIGLEVSETKTLNILKEYRESIQARKDIKNTNDLLLEGVGYLKPILMFLNSNIAPSVRIELLQKIELYFHSGWGYDDLVINKEKTDTVKSINNILNDLKSYNKEDDKWSIKGQEFLELLKKRIHELGVPVKITNKLNINNEKIPTASIENKEEHIFNDKKVTAAGFVDWAIPDFKDNSKLHFSLATSDETCFIENSQLFRYGYAINNLTKTHPIYKKHELYFFSVSNFYDELENNKKEIGSEFINRYGITNKERETLNLLPFLSMTDKISSNYQTGIYSIQQLEQYNLCLVGAKSLLENKTVNNIENILSNAIKSTISIFNRDTKNEKITDSKTLQIVTYLYNLISTAQNELYNNSNLMNELFSETTINSLNKIRKKLPDASLKDGLVNKNEFQRLIDVFEDLTLEKFQIKQNNRNKEAIEELNKKVKLDNLFKKVNQLMELNNEINNNLDNKFIDEEWLNGSQEYRIKKYKELYFDNVYSLLVPKNSAFNDNIKNILKNIQFNEFNDKIIDLKNRNTLNEIINNNSNYKKEILRTIDNSKSILINSNHNNVINVNNYIELNKVLRNVNLQKDKKLNLLLNYSYVMLGLDSLTTIEKFKIPTAFTLEKYSVCKKCDFYKVNENIKNLNELSNYINQENINSIIYYNESINETKNKIIKNIKENYNEEDINYIENKYDLYINKIKNNKTKNVY